MPDRNILMIGAAAIALIAAPAFADVRAGIDSYQRGDFAAAVSAWRPLADAGDPDAQYNLGQAYRLGRGVPVDPPMAESWFRKAADQGHERARNAYGLTLFQSGRRREAIPYIEESAGHGYPQSQYVFATLLFNGDIVERDWVRSYALMTRAAAGDVAAARAGLAQLDQYIPLDQRQRGLKLAQVFEASATNPKAGGSTIGNEERPPSRIAAMPRTTVAAAPKPTAIKSAPLPKVAGPAVGGNWRIQFGAFGTVAAASALWTRLQRQVGALGPYRNYLVPAGALTRLQAGPLLTRTAAAALCATVTSAGNACLVVTSSKAR